MPRPEPWRWWTFRARHPVLLWKFLLDLVEPRDHVGDLFTAPPQAADLITPQAPGDGVGTKVVNPCALDRGELDARGRVWVIGVFELCVGDQPGANIVKLMRKPGGL